jgi:GT2 family glycosyltransferase
MNRAGDLERLLDSVPSQTRSLDEMIVVDAGEDDAEAVVDAFREKAPACRVVYRHTHPGVAHQRNMGIGEAHADIVHFMDDDCVLDPGYIEAVQHYFEADTEIAVLGVAPMLSLNHGKPGPWASRVRRFFMLTQTDGSGRLQPSGFGTFTFYANFTEPHPLEVASGCCAYRRSILAEENFDEYFDRYGRFEDIELAYRVSRRGRLVGLPEARMDHLESPRARTGLRRLARVSIVTHYYVYRKLVPRTMVNRLCFWWSELGQNLYRFRQFLRTGDWGVFPGIVEGYADILRGRGTPSSTLYER